MDLTRYAIEEFLRFVLVAARMSGLFILAPVLASAGVPRRVRMALAAIVALVVFPVLAGGPAALNVGAFTWRGYVMVLLGELAVGFTIGLVAAIVLAGIELAGLFVGQQTGLALANVLNPSNEDQTSVMGQFYSFFALTVFLVIGGHRTLVLALLTSFQAVPLGGLHLNAEFPQAVIGLSGQMFTIGFVMSAPVVVAMTLTEIALGLIARTVPQLNILVVGFPVRVILGWGVVLLSLAGVALLSRDLFVRMFEDLAEIVSLM